MQLACRSWVILAYLSKTGRLQDDIVNFSSFFRVNITESGSGTRYRLGRSNVVGTW